MGRGFVSVLGTAIVFHALVGCAEGEDEEIIEEGEKLGVVQDELSLQQFKAKVGEIVFKKVKFQGNDRTCSTCHSGSNGTLTLDQIDELFTKNPAGPLFRAIDSDDGTGASYDRLRDWGTVKVVLPLPDNFRPLDDLDATHVVLNRGIPTTFNSGLMDVLMYDTRAPDLREQALGAVNAHAEPGRQPKEWELAVIEDYEQTLFSNPQLKAYFNGGPEPTLPAGTTASEIRGRAFIEPDGACGICHSGPMLDETSGLSPLIPTQGQKTEFVLAGELDFQPNPLREWAFIDPDTKEVLEVVPFPFPDPGLFLTTGDPGQIADFKISSLWNVANTPPYFHDNSARTLEEMLLHYQTFFLIFPEFEVALSDDDLVDIGNYLKLL